MMHIFANPLLADMALISDDRGNPKSILATLAEGAYIDTLKAPEMKLFPGAEEEKPSFSFRVKLAQDGKEIASQFVKSSAYEFEDMHVQVPSGTGAQADHAEWVISGKLKISTSEGVSSPK